MISAMAIRKMIAQIYWVSSHYLKWKSFNSNKCILILTYHRVVDPQREDRLIIHPGIYVTPHTFEMQMQYLKENLNVIPFDEYLKDSFAGASSEKTTCIVTFDDGWKDNYENAFPILKKYHIPATIFLATDYIGTTKWFWQQKVAFQMKRYLQEKSLKYDLEMFKQYPWLKPHFSGGFKSKRKPEIILDSIIEELKRRRPEEIEKAIAEIESITGIKAYPSHAQILNWQEISEMSEEGIAFGSHGLTHRPFTELSDEEVASELVNSKDVLENRRINYVPVLAYPNGNFSEKIQSLAKKSGYRAAVTTLPGSNSEESDFMTLRRVGIHEDITLTIPLFSLRIRCSDIL